MAGFSERALGMAGGTIGLATIAAWLGLVHSSAPQTGGIVIVERVTIAPE